MTAMADAFDRAVQDRFASLERQLSVERRRRRRAEDLARRLLGDVARHKGLTVEEARTHYVDTMRDLGPA